MKEKKRKKHGILRWVFSLIGLALMIFIAVFLIVNRDKLNSDSISELFGSSKKNQALQIQLETDAQAAFAVSNKSLAVAFRSGVRLYDKSGEALLSASAGLDNPAVCSSSKWTAMYSIGGLELTVVSPKGEKATVGEGKTISSVSLSEGGMAVVTDEQGYKSLVTVYDNSMAPVYKWYSGSGYVTNAAVSPNGKRLAVLSVSTNGSLLQTFETDSENVKGSFADAETLALDAAFISDSRIAVLTEKSVRVFDASAQLVNEFDFDGMQLMDYSFQGDGFAVIALSNGRWSDEVSIIVLNSDGLMKKQVDISGEFRSLSAAKSNISVLFADRLEIYRSGLEKAAECPAQGAQKVLQRDDGAAIAIYDYMAEIYNS